MAYLKFDLAKIAKLDDSGRFESLQPDVMWDALGAPDNARAIVEIGAGTGMFATRFAEMAPSSTVYALDTEQQMLDWMQANRPLVSQGRLVPVLSQESHVPIDDDFADIVFMINLHHELAEPDAIYAEAYRITRRGGRILVVDWAPKETPRGPALAVCASAEEIADFVGMAGFTDVCVHADALVWHTLVTAEKR